jgi:hypothetical protein
MPFSHRLLPEEFEQLSSDAFWDSLEPHFGTQALRPLLHHAGAGAVRLPDMPSLPEAGPPTHILQEAAEQAVLTAIQNAVDSFADVGSKLEGGIFSWRGWASLEAGVRDPLPEVELLVPLLSKTCLSKLACSKIFCLAGESSASHL